MGYTQLSLSERYQIYELLKRHWTVSQIASWNKDLSNAGRAAPGFWESRLEGTPTEIANERCGSF